MAMDSLTFRIPEILSLVGLVQCVYVLVYMAFRAGNVRYALLPGAYFLLLGVAFFLDFAQRFIGGDQSAYALWQAIAWFSGPALSVLLIIQAARAPALPRLLDFWVLLLPVTALAVAMIVARLEGVVLNDVLTICGIVAGGVAMLAVWMRRGMLNAMRQDRQGMTRYWLVMTLLLMNGAFLATMLVSLGPWLMPEQTVMIRTITGLGLVYLAGTALLRIYPQNLNVIARPHGRVSDALGAEDRVLAARIESLLDLDKVYQEATYNRSALARELDIPETVVSRIINAHFGKSFPQVLNERRIADAKRLLQETAAPVKQVAEEVGFNSMATFNRVFREATGITPTEYRQTLGGRAA